jgi:3',5'-cyclic AMP phosphodiesterase CpdA
MVGDIVYYGRIEHRFNDVFLQPLGPLVDAGVAFEVALGNHDGPLFLGEQRTAEIERTLTRLGTPSRFYTTSHGPVDFFYLDSVAMVRDPAEARRQVVWLDEALAASAATWRVVCLHHPVWSSGRHGPTPGLVERLAPVLASHDVDLTLSGHDHHYERTRPIDGVTYVITGAGCKLSPVDPRPFAEVATSRLQFLRLHATRDRLVGRCIGVDGGVLDTFELAARSRA